MAFKPISWLKRVWGGLRKHEPAIADWAVQFASAEGKLAWGMAVKYGPALLLGQGLDVPAVVAEIIKQEKDLAAIQIPLLFNAVRGVQVSLQVQQVTAPTA